MKLISTYLGQLNTQKTDHRYILVGKHKLEYVLLHYKLHGNHRTQGTDRYISQKYKPGFLDIQYSLHILADNLGDYQCNYLNRSILDVHLYHCIGNVGHMD